MVDFAAHQFLVECIGMDVEILLRPCECHFGNQFAAIGSLVPQATQFGHEPTVASTLDQLPALDNFLAGLRLLNNLSLEPFKEFIWHRDDWSIVSNRVRQPSRGMDRTD